MDPKALKLYLCTDRVLSGGRPLTDAVESAIRGGVTMVQIREKEAPTREFYNVARDIQAITKRRGVPLIVNDRIDIALAIGAEGVHLGQSDMPVEAARRLAPHLWIGISAATVEEALAAQEKGADYLGVGPVFTTGSKADAGEGIGLGMLRRIREAVRIPLVGIGGIGPDNAGDVMKAGADGISVISAILTQPDIEMAARLLYSCLKSQ
ncbi:MAG: thiamine phosphate synthase [Oscillospiraceae bacterium]|nr:thiamine phosphate synthase [Oscillospiraceae bacterium]